MIFPVVSSHNIYDTFDNISLSFEKGYGKSGILKTLEQTSKWIPLYPSEELSWLVGVLMGDGHLTLRKTKIKTGQNKGKIKTLVYVSYYDQNKYMQKIFVKNIFDIFNFQPTKSIVDHANNPHKYGSKQNVEFRIRNSAIVRTLYCCGVPKGDKMLEEFYVPNWIMCGTDNIKSGFLRGLMDSEGWIIKKLPATIAINMSKDVLLHEEQIKFMLQLKELFEWFDVKTTKIYEKRGNSRLDGHKTKQFLFVINRKKSILNYYKNIGFFHPKKNRILNKHVKVFTGAM